MPFVSSIIILWLITFVLKRCESINCNLPEVQYNALKSIYDESVGKEWTVPGFATKWSYPSAVNAPCEDNWAGVTCVCNNQKQYDVTKLALPNYNMQGKISMSIGNLSSLQYLDISFNALEGEIPASTYQLTGLTTLDLGSNNNLRGSISSEIGQLLLLEGLYLNSNTFTGTIPSEIGQLTSLAILDLQLNKLTGTIPSELSQQTLLSSLSLYTNMLTGSIPSVLVQQSLEYFYLYFNMLTGSIPSVIGQLSSLVHLALNSNTFTGSIPSEIGQLLSLEYLGLYSNLLTRSIPSTIGGLSSIMYLELYSNLLTGSIPSEIGKQTSLEYLYLYSNLLAGTIPSEIGQLTSLQHLFLYSNLLTGSIPSEIGQMTSLEYLFLYSNMLTGSIPSSLGNLTKLTEVDINSNHISGTIPSTIGFMVLLSGLFVYSNNLAGPIPSSFSKLKLLTSLYLFNNSLTSYIPKALDRLPLLQNLFLQSNMISSTIPDTFSNLKNLQIICLDDNIISGTFPSGIIALSLLSQISLSNNLLSGNILSSFVSNRVTVFNVANNNFTSSIANDLFDLSTSLTTIIASGNCFVGSIPNNVCKIMNNLTIFDFSNSGGNSLCHENRHVQSLRPSFVHGTFSQLGLSGTIPSCLLQSSTMIALKLSGNKLEGTMSSNPTTISSSLRNLTLANNALTGSIPTWIQQHMFLELDLSNNRLDGTLSSDFTVASDQTTLGLAVNRLSGPLPHSIVDSSVNMTSLNVLAGNIFGCNNNNLPALDPSSASYTCGSGDLDISAYTWLVCVGFFVVVTIMVITALYRHPGILDFVSLLQVIDELILWRSTIFMQSHTSNDNTKQHNIGSYLPEVVSFILLSRFISISVVFIVSICLFAALPLFVGLHGDNAIVSYDYGYFLSIAYLHGIAPVVAVSCLLAVILLIAAAFIPSFIEYMAKIPTGRQTLEKSRLSTFPFTTNIFLNFNWNNFRNYLLLLLLNLINIVVVMTVNISYVATLAHRVNYNRAELLVIQVSVGLFKVVWNTFYVAWSCDWLASFFTHRGSMRSRYVMSIVNYIVAPVISTIVYNESCFYYVFNNQGQVTSTIVLAVTYFEACNDIGCLQTIFININSKSSSSFVYSYACGSALIVAYTPVFFSSALFYGLFQQITRLLLALDKPSQFAIGFKNLPKRLFVRLIKPDNTSTKDSPLTEKPGVRVNGRDTIVRLMVQMTVMLTFGLASPVLIIPLAFAVIMDCKVSQLLVGKCIHENEILVTNINSDYIKSVNLTPKNQPGIEGIIPNSLIPDPKSTMKADLLIMEHLDMQSSWQGLDVCFYPMIMLVMLFWALLFFDMIADEYGTINGIITMTCFATLPTIFSIVIIKSKAMASILSYLDLIRVINNCIDKLSTTVLDTNSKLKRDGGRAMDVELSAREIEDTQSDIQLNPIIQPAMV